MPHATPVLSTRGRSRPAAVLRVVEGPGSLRFDSAEYDEATDRLRLTAGPPTAASTESSREGDLLGISAPDGRLCEVIVSGARRRLAGEGRITLTLGDDLRLAMDGPEAAALLGRDGAGRFRRG